MKEIITKNILLSTFLLLSLTGYSFAAPALPVSTQVTEDSKKKAGEEKIELIPEIKINAQATTSPKNPKLKDGSACSDENLEEVKGELFTEIPMAKTMPCDKVDCNDLSAAKMHKDNYVKLKTAKTISCDK
jgi:hypothetical protein